MDELLKQQVIDANLASSRNQGGAKMNVPRKGFRFPVYDGMQQKVTLKSNKTGTYANIGFMAGMDNTINGNIADYLLDAYPDVFKVHKVNGRIISQGVKDKEREALKAELLAELKEDFEIKVKDKKPSSRDRTAHKDIADGKEPAAKTENKFK